MKWLIMWIKGKDKYYITNGKYTIGKYMVKGKWKYALFDGNVNIAYDDDVNVLKNMVKDAK